jgi:hypothetical protein
MHIRSACVLGVLASAFALPAQRDGGPIRPGPWQSAGKVPAGWVVHNTKNYQVQSECGLEKAKRLGEHMEIMNEVYRKMFRPDKVGAKQQAIKLFKDEQGFHAYGAPGSAAAYYSFNDREMVCYDTGKWSDEKKPEGAVTGSGKEKESPLDRIRRRMSRFSEMMTMDLLGCAAHEGWHQYFHWYVGSTVSLPSWINEGMGDYFYTAAPKETKGKKIPAELGRMNDGRLWVLQTLMRQDRFVPLAQLLPMLQQEFYANPDVCYAEGWAFCQFLLHAPGGKYAKVIPNYIHLVKDDTNVETVTQKAFKGIDIKALETEFKAWVTALPVAEDPMKAIEEETEGEPAPAGEPPAPQPPGEGTPPPGRDPNGTGGGGVTPA